MILIFLSQLVNFRSAQVVCCCSDVSKTKLLLQLVNAGTQVDFLTYALYAL